MTARVLILLLTLSASVSTQDLSRGKVFGMVRQADGQPRAGATVQLLSRPFPEDERIGLPDAIETRTDERGRFRAQIIEGRPYSAWATSPEPDGGSWVTSVQERVFPSVPVILDETIITPAITVQFAGLGRWTDRRPLRCLAISDTTNVHVVELAVDEQGRVELPPWPGERIELALLGKNDFPLALEKIDVPRASPCEIAIPEPKQYGFAIYDIDTNKGLAGVRLCRQWRDRLLPLGETDADGVALLMLPWEHRPSTNIGAHASVIADADGYTWAGAQHGPGELWGEHPLRDGVTIDWHAHLGPETLREARIWLAEDVPADNLPLLVEATTVHYQKKNSRHVGGYRTLYHTDADGKVRIPHTWNEFSTLVDPVLQPSHLARLPEAWRERMSPLVPGAYYLRDAETAGDLRLDLLQPVDLHIVTTGGLDAPEASCVLYTETDNMLARKVTLTADRRGRLRLLLRRGRVYPLLVQSGGIFGRAQIRVIENSTPPGIESLTMLLSPTIPFIGRLVDEAGNGLAGVDLTCRTIPDDDLDAGAEDTDTPQDELTGSARIEKLGIGDRGHMLRQIMQQPPDAVTVRTLEGGRFSVDVSLTAAGVSVTAKPAYPFDVTIKGEDIEKGDVTIHAR